MSNNYLSKNSELRKGDYLMSNNKQWKAIFQDDGNFVIYGWKPVWASDTYGVDVLRLCMQNDCNLVMYNKSNEAKWHTNTHVNGDHSCRLQLTDDGKLMVTKDSDVLWTSAMNHGIK